MSLKLIRIHKANAGEKDLLAQLPHKIENDYDIIYYSVCVLSA